MGGWTKNKSQSNLLCGLYGSNSFSIWFIQSFLVKKNSTKNSEKKKIKGLHFDFVTFKNQSIAQNTKIFTQNFSLPKITQNFLFNAVSNPKLGKF